MNAFWCYSLCFYQHEKKNKNKYNVGWFFFWQTIHFTIAHIKEFQAIKSFYPHLFFRFGWKHLVAMIGSWIQSLFFSFSLIVSFRLNAFAVAWTYWCTNCVPFSVRQEMLSNLKRQIENEWHTHIHSHTQHTKLYWLSAMNWTIFLWWRFLFVVLSFFFSLFVFVCYDSIDGIDFNDLATALMKWNIWLNTNELCELKKAFVHSLQFSFYFSFDSIAVKIHFR